MIEFSICWLALIVQKWAKTFTSNVLIILINVIVIEYVVIVRIVNNIDNFDNHVHLKRLDNPDQNNSYCYLYCYCYGMFVIVIAFLCIVYLGFSRIWMDYLGADYISFLLDLSIGKLGFDWLNLILFHSTNLVSVFPKNIPALDLVF